uniref:Uncharacterized protein n=1 Tax=Rhizophora mucronata TaxID=61149 RepID=A0A2P2PT74_RHIMU
MSVPSWRYFALVNCECLSMPILNLCLRPLITCPFSKFPNPSSSGEDSKLAFCQSNRRLYLDLM